MQVAATAEHPGAGVPVALAREPAAHHVHRLHQVLGDVRVRTHVGPGAGLGHPARGSPEHTGRLDDQVAVDAGDAARELGGHRLDRGAERVEAVDPPRAEVDVVQTFGEDRAQQRREQRDVGAGDELEVKVGMGGDLRSPRIDDDQLQTSLPCLLEPAQAVVHRETGEVATLHRHQRVRSHEEPHVGVFEPLAAGCPGSEARGGDPFRRLVDRHRGEALVGANGAEPRPCEAERQ